MWARDCSASKHQIPHKREPFTATAGERPSYLKTARIGYMSIVIPKLYQVFPALLYNAELSKVSS